MNRARWQILLGIVMIMLSVIFYIIHYFVFRDLHLIFVNLLQEIAFVFIQVLLVSLIIHGLLNEREKRERMDKIKMVIGAFFSQLGTDLLSILSSYDRDVDAIKKVLVISPGWTNKDFIAVLKGINGRDFNLDLGHKDMESVRNLLKGNRDFLLRILENPTLHEHETFTELLWAVFHIIEELTARKSLKGLPHADLEHLKKDTARAYKSLIHEWIMHMEHLKNNYPYLFSFALRTNPFDDNSKVVIEKI